MEIKEILQTEQWRMIADMQPKLCKPGDNNEASLKPWKKKAVNPEFYTQWKYLYKNEEKINFFQTHKSWKNLLPNDLHDVLRNVKWTPLSRINMIDGHLVLHKEITIFYHCKW